MDKQFLDAQGNISVTPEQAVEYYEKQKQNKKKAKNIILDAILVLLAMVIVATGIYTAVLFSDIQKNKKQSEVRMSTSSLTVS